MPDQVTVTGDKELGRALDGMSEDVARMDAAAADAARLVAADAQRRAPRRSGRLRSSIGATVERGQVTVGTAVSYGWPVHSGVPSHHMAAQPFLTDALAAQQSAVQAVYARDLDKLVTTNAAKADH